ncbi:Uncharacterised protein [Vibrio cholerae]|nr:Uncharacterised protein [Vibrio cholerae]
MCCAKRGHSLQVISCPIAAQQTIDLTSKSVCASSLPRLPTSSIGAR